MVVGELGVSESSGRRGRAPALRHALDTYRAHCQHRIIVKASDENLLNAPT